MRPVEYSPGSQYPCLFQYYSILNKLLYNTFLSGLYRQIQEYWFRVFNIHCRKLANDQNPVSFLLESIKLNQKVITKHLNYCAIPCGIGPPYLLFAVTSKTDFG